MASGRLIVGGFCPIGLVCAQINSHTLCRMIMGKRRTEFVAQVEDVSQELREAARAGTNAFLAVTAVAVIALVVASVALLRASR